LAKKLHQDSPVFTVNTYRMKMSSSRQTIKQFGLHPDSAGMIPSMDSRMTFFTHSASIYENSQMDWEYNMEFPSVVETNNGAQKESRPSSPSVTSGITGMLLSTSAQGGPSYASVTANQLEARVRVVVGSEGEVVKISPIIRSLFSGYTQIGHKPSKGITCPIPEEPGYYCTKF
jgi:hypothetical protein